MPNKDNPNKDKPDIQKSNKLTKAQLQKVSKLVGNTIKEIKNDPVHLNWRRYYASIKEHDKAITSFIKVMDEPDVNEEQKTVAYNNIKLTYEEKEAMVDFDNIIDLDSQLAIAYNNRGLVYEKKGKIYMAMKDYEHFLKYSEKNPHLEDIAKQRIQEFNKAPEIPNIVEEIKDLLRYNEEKVVHYTGLSTAKILLLAQKTDAPKIKNAFVPFIWGNFYE